MSAAYLHSASHDFASDNTTSRCPFASSLHLTNHALILSLHAILQALSYRVMLPFLSMDTCTSCLS